MRHALIVSLLTVLFAQPAWAQDRLPQISSTPGELRPLTTLDDVADWEAIGRVDTQVSFCSGTLIAPDLVLTAAHCLFDGNGRRLQDETITFSASLRNGRAEAYRQVRRAYAHPDYPGINAADKADALAHDIALLQLDQPIPFQSIQPITSGPAGREREPVTVVSYGRTRERHPSIEEGCAILQQDGDIILMDCNVVSGSSGAPILRVNQGRAEVIAVMSAEAQWRGDSVAVAVSVATLLPDLMAMHASSAGPARLPGAVRRVIPGQTGRDGIGARFIRP